MGERLNIIGLGGRGGNAISHLKGVKNFPGNRFSYLSHYNQMLNTYHGELDIDSSSPLRQRDSYSQLPSLTLEKITSFSQEFSKTVLIAGLGGNTGGNGIQALSQAYLEKRIPFMCLIFTPFNFEGAEQQARSTSALMALKQLDVPIVTFHNQDIFKIADEKTTMASGFQMIEAGLATFISKINDYKNTRVLKNSFWDFSKGCIEKKAV